MPTACLRWLVPMTPLCCMQGEPSVFARELNKKYRADPVPAAGARSASPARKPVLRRTKSSPTPRKQPPHERKRLAYNAEVEAAAAVDALRRAQFLAANMRAIAPFITPEVRARIEAAATAARARPEAHVVLEDVREQPATVSGSMRVRV